MTDNLREEIYQYILTLIQHYDKSGINLDKEANVYTWELVTKIKKRIDEKIKFYENECKDFHQGILYIKIETCKDIKEMLK